MLPNTGVTAKEAACSELVLPGEFLLYPGSFELRPRVVMPSMEQHERRRTPPCFSRNTSAAPKVQLSNHFAARPSTRTGRASTRGRPGRQRSPPRASPPPSQQQQQHHACSRSWGGERGSFSGTRAGGGKRSRLQNVGARIPAVQHIWNWFLIPGKSRGARRAKATDINLIWAGRGAGHQPAPTYEAVEIRASAGDPRPCSVVQRACWKRHHHQALLGA